jgi:hypothetical protein
MRFGIRTKAEIKHQPAYDQIKQTAKQGRN